MGDIMDSIIEHLCDSLTYGHDGQAGSIKLPSGRTLEIGITYDDFTNPFTDWDCYGTIVGADGEIA